MIISSEACFWSRFRLVSQIFPSIATVPVILVAGGILMGAINSCANADTTLSGNYDNQSSGYVTTLGQSYSVISPATFNNNANSGLYANDSVVTVNGGTFSGNYYGLRGDSLSQITVNSGTFDQNNTGLDGSNLIISGGHFDNNSVTGVYAESSAAISGGTFNNNGSGLGNGLTLEKSASISGGTFSGNYYGVDDEAATSVTVSNGLFTSNYYGFDGDFDIYGTSVSNQSDVSINGGTFSGNTYGLGLAFGYGDSISGGSFTGNSVGASIDYENAPLNIMGGNFTGNSDFGLELFGSSVNIYGGQFTGNGDDDILLDGGTLTLYGNFIAAPTPVFLPSGLQPNDTLEAITGTLQDDTAPQTFTIDVGSGSTLRLLPANAPTIPEPAPVVLLGVGALGLLLPTLRARRRTLESRKVNL